VKLSKESVVVEVFNGVVYIELGGPEPGVDVLAEASWLA